MNILTQIFTHKREHPLVYRILVYILLCSSAFTLIATALQLYFDYQRDVSLIEERIEQIETSYLASVEYSVWLFDPEGVDLQLQGILQLPDLEYLKVKTSTGEIYTAGQVPKNDTIIKHVFPLLYVNDGEQHDLGRLEVIANLEGVYQRLIDKTLVILATQAVKTFIVSLFILFIVQYLVTRHLGQMAWYARQLDLEHLHNPLVLSRQSSKKPDELEQVVNAINEMRTSLIEDIRKRQEADEAMQKLQLDNERMKTELDITRRLQQMILPKEQELEQVTGLDIAGFMEPAEEVGGDYYDVLQHQGRVLFGIGDATGHGLESGMLMLMTQAAVRTLLENGETDYTKFLKSINGMIYKNVQERMEAGRNLTLSLLEYQVLPEEKGGLLHVSGQHEEMIVVHDGHLELVDTSDLGFMIGFLDDISEYIAQTQVELKTGDVVVLYTDGITEAENAEREEYGIERLCEVIKQNWAKTAQEIRQAIIAHVRQYIGTHKIFDDITLLVLKQQ